MRDFIDPMIKFYIVGGVGTIVNLGILYVLTDFLNIWYMLSAVIAISVSITTNFFGNRLWTFKNQLSERSSLYLQYRNFWLVSLLGIISQLALIYILVEYFNIWYVLASFFGIVTVSFVKFLLSKFWVFKS